MIGEITKDIQQPSKRCCSHESVRPPFSLRCPHCSGEIVIDYAGKPGADRGDGAAEKAADQQGQTAGAMSVATSLVGDFQRSTAGGIEPPATGPKVAIDPFSWKKQAR